MRSALSGRSFCRARFRRLQPPFPWGKVAVSMTCPDSAVPSPFQALDSFPGGKVPVRAPAATPKSPGSSGAVFLRSAQLGNARRSLCSTTALPRSARRQHRRLGNGRPLQQVAASREGSGPRDRSGRRAHRATPGVRQADISPWWRSASARGLLAFCSRAAPAWHRSSWSCR